MEASQIHVTLSSKQKLWGFAKIQAPQTLVVIICQSMAHLMLAYNHPFFFFCILLYTLENALKIW